MMNSVYNYIFGTKTKYPSELYLNTEYTSECIRTEVIKLGGLEDIYIYDVYLKLDGKKIHPRHIQIPNTKLKYPISKLGKSMYFDDYHEYPLLYKDILLQLCPDKDINVDHWKNNIEMYLLMNKYSICVDYGFTLIHPGFKTKCKDLIMPD